MKVLILGASGMLGNAMFRFLSRKPMLQVYGTLRSRSALKYFDKNLIGNLLCGVDVENQDSLVGVFARIKPDVVINCIGLVKQLDDSEDPLCAIPINSLLPHRLASLCNVCGARFIHVSTDCVFSGMRGGYVESDFPDANDLYGRSKFIGEVVSPNCITLRTSIVGHELSGSRSLLCWFLAQEGVVKGYRNAVFSGLPTNELARVVSDFVIPRPELCGLFHVAAKPIDKYSLLKIFSDVYGRGVEIVPDDSLIIDRSLCAERFKSATGYVAPEWPDLIKDMYEFH